MNKKEEYEKKIIKLTREILDKETLKKVKEERRDDLLKIKDRKPREDKELQFIENNEKIEELVEANFCKEFLMDISPLKKIVLSMGINPGGGAEIVKIPEKTKDTILFTNWLDKEEKSILEILKNYYIFTHGYHKNNYDIFEKIDAKAHWALDGYLADNEVLKIINNCKALSKLDGKQYNNIDEKRIIDVIHKMQKKEREKKNGPYVIFWDLIWYSDGNQSNIKRALRYDNINEIIRKIILLNIDYYKPEMIVVTNAYASDLIIKSLSSINENKKYNDVIYIKNTPIILGAMVSGRRPIDKYSLIRLKDRIQEIYKEKETKWRKFWATESMKMETVRIYTEKILYSFRMWT